MNLHSDRERLLADVLAEAEPPDFRAALLGETLRLARRRRHTRRACRASALLATIGALSLFAWRASPSRNVDANYQLVATHPLPTNAQIATRPFDRNEIVSSFPNVATIRTRLDESVVRRIDDRELLALAAPRPAALIRLGPQSQTLIFMDAVEQPDGSQ